MVQKYKNKRKQEQGDVQIKNKGRKTSFRPLTVMKVEVYCRVKRTGML